VNLTLRRVSSTKDATYGVLLREGIPFLVTVERPWLDNAPRQSCIPTGVYACKRVQSPRFGDTFEVTGVTGRSHILFHAGNVAADSLGCILVGNAFDPVGGVDGVVESKDAFAEFLAVQGSGKTFTLTVL